MMLYSYIFECSVLNAGRESAQLNARLKHITGLLRGPHADTAAGYIEIAFSRLPKA